jgi:hypothetical protein
VNREEKKLLVSKWRGEQRHMNMETKEVKKSQSIWFNVRSEQDGIDARSSCC